MRVVFLARTALAWVPLSLAVSGCEALRLRPISTAEEQYAADSDKPRDVAPEKTAEQRKAAALLSLDGWNAALAPQPPIDPSEGYRWRLLRNPDLEALLALPADERPDFAAALAGGDPVTVTNAAICLARLGDGRGRNRLIEAVRDADLRLPMRCAAAEALAELRDPSPVPVLRELVDRYGQFSSPSYLAELHAELLYGLAAHVDAGTDDRFTAATKSPAAAVRLAAVRGWLRPGEAALPDAAADLRTDPDHRVRAATLGAMVARHHPLALEAARNGLSDYRLEVRLAAVAALGELGGGEAQKLLEKLDHEPEVIRAAAIAALARLGARDRVWAGAESESWHVRRAVAAALSEWPDAGGALLARQFITDPSIEVQKQVLVTLTKWPLEKSGPVLLEAMGGNGYLSRKSASAQLAERWPPAREFTADAPAERRTEVLARLRQQWSQEHGITAPDTPAPESVAKASMASPRAPEQMERAAQIVGRLQSAPPGGRAAADALRELAALGPDLPSVLARLIEERQVVLPDAVYREVLPRYGEAFAELERLSSPDVQQRRRAANHLAALAAEEPLNSLALARLSEIGAGEPDTLVFSGVFRTIARDAREPAVRLAYAGLGHGNAEVRRMAADYLGEHPSPDHARVLVPALDDKNQAVVLVTVKALGHPGMLSDPAPLERLLISKERVIRLAVAESLIHLGADSGPPTLELLAQDIDIDTRRQAAQLMGRVGDQRYTETLIGLLDDTLGVRTAALASLPKVVGQDMAYRPDDPPTSTLDQVERWKSWWRSQKSRQP